MAFLRLYRDKKLRGLNMVINTDMVEKVEVKAEGQDITMNEPRWSLHITSSKGKVSVITGLIQQKANGALVAILNAANGGKDAKKEYSVESASGSRINGQREETESREARREKIEKNKKMNRVFSWAKAGGYGAPPEGWAVGDPVPEELATENVMTAKAKTKSTEQA